jgi:DNA-binding MarR family transcriptional regulator
MPTSEQIVQVEERYTQLAQPSEFDGIRTQISKELNIPKKAVKKIIKDLRDRQHIPSWWEVQTYKGSQEELDRIKEAYQPYLPVPPMGVHKEISEKLNLKPGTVYQAIKTIRIELKLPQYNDPKYHEEEIAAHIKKLQAKKIAHEANETAITHQIANTSFVASDNLSDSSSQSD